MLIQRRQQRCLPCFGRVIMQEPVGCLPLNRGAGERCLPQDAPYGLAWSEIAGCQPVQRHVDQRKRRRAAQRLGDGPPTAAVAALQCQDEPVRVFGDDMLQTSEKRFGQHQVVQQACRTGQCSERCELRVRRMLAQQLGNHAVVELDRARQERRLALAVVEELDQTVIE